MNSKLKYSTNNIIKRIRKIVSKQLIKYSSDEITYKIKVLRDILYNEKSHLVARFKDYLLLDDCSEFLKRFYNFKESGVRLSKLYEFYEINSKIFPNYIILSESRYIYKNIQRKQKLIDFLQYLEKKNTEKHKLKIKKTQKLFNSSELESLMKQSDCTNLEYRDTENKQDVSASVDILINVIENAEKKIKIKIENDMNFNIKNESESKKPTPKIYKNFKIKHLDLNNQETQTSNLNCFKMSNLNDNYGKIGDDKIKSYTLGKDTSRTLSQSNTKLTGNENNKSKDKLIVSHTKFLSMPKLTINNNVINNITVINNNSVNTKTIINYNKTHVNNDNNIVTIPKKNEFYVNFNNLNQKNTRNLKNNIIAGRNNQFITKTLNTLDLGKEIFSSKSKFPVSNFPSTSVITQTIRNDSSLAKNNPSLTTRAVPLIKNLMIEKNFQTIDNNNQKKINLNNLLEDLNMIGENHKLKLMKIKSDSSQKENYSKKSSSVFKIPQLKNKVNVRQVSNSINKQIDHLPNYPVLKDIIKHAKPLSDRGIINNNLKFLKTMSKLN